MKEKFTVLLGIGVITLVIFTFGFYMINNSAIDLFYIISIPVILIIVITSSYLVYDKYKNIKAGLPTDDERLKQSGYKAGYYGFIAAIWSAVGYNMGHIILLDQEPRGGLVVAAVVLVSGIVFMLSYFYLSRKGEWNENKDQGTSG